jgi:hypothetical protein
MNFFHNGTKVTHLDGVKMPGSQLIEFRGTEAECQAERDRLSLKDPQGLLGEVIPIVTRSENAIAFFNAQPEEARAPFLELVPIILSVQSDESKAKLIEALAVPVELQPLQAQLVTILRA